MERVIGLLKKKNNILEGPLPINLIKHKSDGQYAINTVCIALTNLSDPVIRK